MITATQKRRKKEKKKSRTYKNTKQNKQKRQYNLLPQISENKQPKARTRREKHLIAAYKDKVTGCTGMQCNAKENSATAGLSPIGISSSGWESAGQNGFGAALRCISDCFVFCYSIFVFWYLFPFCYLFLFLLFISVLLFISWLNYCFVYRRKQCWLVRMVSKWLYAVVRDFFIFLLFISLSLFISVVCYLFLYLHLFLCFVIYSMVDLLFCLQKGGVSVVRMDSKWLFYICSLYIVI